MQIIRNWLKGQQNFVVGTTLYKTFGKDEKLKELLAKGETSNAKKLLREALEEMVKPGEPQVALPQKPVDKETEEMPSSGEPVLDSLKNKWKPLYERMNLLRHSLDKYGSSNTTEAIEYRQPIAREIKELELQCKAIWAKRDYYLKEGKLPFVAETKLDIPTDPIELAKLISNIKNYIRRYRKKLEKDPANAKYAQFLLDYKAQHKQVTGKDYEEKD
jgi:hypothetical protein